ncbi:recombinase family protein [Alkalihalophilus marmarensis]|uniref:recombinase family protein n=1 Tax=Alkalihalophilus marmarensis TaxID=521377 RepID=UPI002DBE027D|nr:recombinase family protein [Alkalihalophilus marmarensis]MEC2074005.1 recombinase family protein [Alkalihalophilus marmarensis]
MVKRERAAIYIRVSTEEQKLGHSLEAQESMLKEFAEKKGYEIFDVYSDGGYSGKNFDRPEIQRLFNDLTKDKIDVILVWKVDRLSRNNTDVVSLIDNELTPRNKKLLITSIDMDSSSPTGHMFISLLSTFARYERATIIDRVNAGMQKRAEKGYWNGGSILGYDSVDKRLIINEQESAVVREIFKLRADGKGYKFIANTLNNRGIKTKKGKSFSIPAIKLIVNNHIYIGKMVWKKHQEWSTKRRAGKAEPIIVDGVHEAIIEQELWTKVQEINEFQKKSFTSNRNFNGNFFLTGLLKCPKCGAGTVMSKSKKKNSDDYHLYYMCQAYHNKGKSVCGTNLIKKEEVEQKVLNEISFLVNNDDIFKELISELNSDNDKVNEIFIADLKNFNRQLKKAYDKRSKLDNDYFEGNIESSTYNRLMSDLQKEIEKLERNIRKSESEITRNESSIDKDEIIYTLKNFNKFFAIVSDEERKLLVRSLIKEIHMEENRKDVKKITFWFSSDNVLPSNKARRTVS